MIEVQLEQAGPSTSKGTARKHSVLVDRPEAKGGADRGPMGGELMLLGIGGCFMSNLLAAIRTREAPVSDVRLRVGAEMGENPQRFTALTLRVSARCEDPGLLEKLTTIAERACISVNTVRDSLPISIVIEEPARAAGD